MATVTGRAAKWAAEQDPQGLLFTRSLASCWGWGEPISAGTVTPPCTSIALSWASLGSSLWLFVWVEPGDPWKDQISVCCPFSPTFFFPHIQAQVLPDLTDFFKLLRAGQKAKPKLCPNTAAVLYLGEKSRRVCRIASPPSKCPIRMYG